MDTRYPIAPPTASASRSSSAPRGPVDGQPRVFQLRLQSARLRHGRSSSVESGWSSNVASATEIVDLAATSVERSSGVRVFNRPCSPPACRLTRRPAGAPAARCQAARRHPHQSGGLWPMSRPVPCDFVCPSSDASDRTLVDRSRFEREIPEGERNTEEENGRPSSVFKTNRIRMYLKKGSARRRRAGPIFRPDA